MPITAPITRAYRSTDQRGWLLCRLFAFFDTCYYDDVHTTRTVFQLPSIQLVADVDNHVVGILDVEINGDAATIDCIAIHPDHQRTGLATQLLAAALAELPSKVRTLDAWTREDPSGLGWYRQQGFVENFHYLHVYKNGEETTDGFDAPAPLSAPVLAFCHARIEHEADVRARFDRVYVCRQFLRDLTR